MSKKQMGFTLIEIVMVLVLLGILSAVAVPKYFDLQEQAEMNAAKATVAEYQARLNSRFASALLNGVSCTNASDFAVSGGGEDGTVYKEALASEDFGGWTVALSGTSLTVTRTSSGNTYPNKSTSTTDKASFEIVKPKCTVQDRTAD